MKKKYDYFIYYFPLFAFLFIGMGSIFTICFSILLFFFCEESVTALC